MAQASVFGRAGLLPRTMTAIIGGAAFLAAAWAGGAWWIAIMALLGVLAATEYAALHPQLGGVRSILVAASAIVVFLAAARIAADPLLLVLGAIVFFGGAVPWLARRMDPHHWTQPPWLIFVQGIAYVGLPLGALVRWRLQETFGQVLWLFLIVWAGDIAAYFVGLLIGRHKMAPKVSPGKSWEGAFAGLIASAVVGLLAAPAYGLAAGGGVVLGMIVSVAAQVGDLFESALKRRAGVKDSGGLLPGHGGVLDRFDAVFFAAPVAYGLLRLWGRI